MVAQTPTAPRLRYEVTGDEGSGVLLVMGIGLRRSAWRTQVRAFCPHHRVLTYDNRGIGESDTAPGLWKMADLAEDALRVLDAVGWERVHLVGVSMGGMVAQHLALGQPHRFRSLTLVATHPGQWPTALPSRRGLELFVAAQSGSPAKRAAALERLLFPDAWVRSVDRRMLDDAISEVSRVASRRTIARQVLATLRHHTASELSRLRLPTLVVKPTGDVLVRPENSDLMAERIPGARVLAVPDGGHGVLFHAADAVNAAMLDHFRRVDAGEAGSARPM